MMNQISFTLTKNRSVKPNEGSTTTEMGEPDRFPEPDLTPEEIEAIYKEYLETCTDEPMSDTEENFICPICGGTLKFLEGTHLKCSTSQCIDLKLMCPKDTVPKIVERIALICQSHAYLFLLFFTHLIIKTQRSMGTGCTKKPQFVTPKEQPELVFADCPECKYINYFVIYPTFT